MTEKFPPIQLGLCEQLLQVGHLVQVHCKLEGGVGRGRDRKREGYRTKQVTHSVFPCALGGILGPSFTPLPHLPCLQRESPQ